MRLSVCVMADIDEIDFCPHVESLGYDSAWVTDSQMLFSDCYAVLALAAQRTSRLRLGPGWPSAARGSRRCTWPPSPPSTVSFLSSGDREKRVHAADNSRPLARARAHRLWPIGATLTPCDPFGIPSTSRWTAAAIIVQ